MQARIAQAWERCKDWITEYEGSPTEAYLPDVSIYILAPATKLLIEQAHFSTIHAIWEDNISEAEMSRPYSLEEYRDLLLRGQIVSLNIVYETELIDFDFRVHIMTYPLGEGLVDLEIIWWSDYAFPDETNHEERFTSILNHFIFLQGIFKAEKLYLSPTTPERPALGSTWIEV